MARREFSVSVRKARLAHATDAEGNVRCEGCGKVMLKGHWAFDHHQPDGLGGEPTFDNCRVLCRIGKTSCHAIKTEEHDKPIMAAADATKNRYQGTAKMPTRKIPSPPKQERAPRRLAEELPQLPRRSLYK